MIYSPDKAALSFKVGYKTIVELKMNTNLKSYLFWHKVSGIQSNYKAVVKDFSLDSHPLAQSGRSQGFDFMKTSDITALD